MGLCDPLLAPGGGTSAGNVLVTGLIGDSCTTTVAAGSSTIAIALPGQELLATGSPTTNRL